MAPTTNILRASRPLFQQQMFASGQAGARVRAAFQQNSHSFRAQVFRESSKRWQSSGAGAGAGAEGGAGSQQASWFQRMWDSPVGIKTVHFWAPIMKWSIVLAGISDFFRPAESLSVTQNFALTCTGLIWTRWCFVIKPRNILLAAVNFFMGCVGLTQLTRIFFYQQSQKGLAGVVEEVKKDAKEHVPTPVKESTTA